MWYVGLDAHKSQSTFCVLDGGGKEVTTRTVHGCWETVVKELGRLDGPFAVCFEASGGSGHLHDELRKVAERVVVANPGKVRLIFRAKRKTDRIDARKLAKLLYLDEVPPVHVPRVQVRSWRALIEHRRRLMKRRTGVKNSIRALLRSHGKSGPRGLWTKDGVAWLAAEKFPTRADALRREVLIEELSELDDKVKRLTRELDRIARGHAGVHLLTTIPGVGARTAEAMVAYVDRADRFTKVRSIGDYIGMVPCQDESAGVRRLGHITKEGPPVLRWLLVEAAWQGIRRSPRLRRYYERARKGLDGRKKVAIVAVARHLAVVCLAMLKSGETWSEEGGLRRAG